MKHLSIGGLLFAAALTIAACSSANGGSSGATSSPSAEPAPASIAPDGDAADTAAGGAAQPAAEVDPEADAGVDTPGDVAVMTLEGDRSFTVSTPGACGISDLTGADDYSAGFETDGDDFWMLSIDVRKYAGPGSYEIVDSAIVGKAVVGITDMMGTYSTSVSGTLTIADDGASGTVDADLEGEGGAVHLSGAFRCELG
jgi:hypothetical protein